MYGIKLTFDKVVFRDILKIFLELLALSNMVRAFISDAFLVTLSDDIDNVAINQSMKWNGIKHQLINKPLKQINYLSRLNCCCASKRQTMSSV